MTVAFFGHRDTPEMIMPRLKQTIKLLAENNRNLIFLLGTHGAFDFMAQQALIKAAEKYSHISCYIALAYLPVNNSDINYYKLPTTYPEGIENVPKRFAISYRNKYMLNKCDTVICFIDRNIASNSAKYVEKAEKQGKTVINLFYYDDYSTSNNTDF